MVEVGYRSAEVSGFLRGPTSDGGALASETSALGGVAVFENEFEWNWDGYKGRGEVQVEG
jgi:hypothetical protein